MSEQSGLLKNIDKVSYGVAALLGLACLALPFLSGGKLASEAQTLERESESLYKKWQDKDPILEPVSEGPGLSEHLAKQFEVVKSSAPNAWATELKPILVRESEKEEAVPAVHLPGQIAEINLQRDGEKKRAGLLVRGVMNPENKFVTIERVVLYKRVDEGQPVVVPRLKATGDFEYLDTEVEPGRQYSYSVASIAASTNTELHPLEETEQRSAELGPTLPIPYDVNLQITYLRKDQTGAPTIRGKKEVYDYDQGEVVRDAKPQTYREGDFLSEKKRYKVRRIVEGTGGSKISVSLRDQVLRRTVTIRQGETYTVASWPGPLLPAETDSSGEASEEDDLSVEDTSSEETSTEETRADPPKTTGPKRGGRRGFGRR